MTVNYPPLNKLIKFLLRKANEFFISAMKISVKVKPNAKVEKAQKLGNDEFILWVKAPAKEGRANEAAIRLLSEYLSVPKTRISILKGHKSKNKLIGLRFE